MTFALVTTALPYANGPIHLGHLTGYIQADIFVRARRLSQGDTVYFVCADDTHGTPIMLAAEKAQLSPVDYIANVQADHASDLAAFSVDYDHYDSTHSPLNRSLTYALYARLQQGGYITQRAVAQLFDPVKQMFLPDRYVKGVCPQCGAPDQYGDNCERCSAVYASTDLKQPRSVISGATPELRHSNHIFFDVAQLTTFLQSWLEGDVAHPSVKAKLYEWIAAPGGLRAWNISRDAPYFGFEIPDRPGQYFYVWLDAPIGYLSSFQALCHKQNLSFDTFLAKDSAAELHHFIGKDIINFHGLFWPALLEAVNFRAPTRLHVNGYLTVDGAKMSKSRGTFIQARAYLNAGLPPDALRYYFAAKSSGTTDDIDLNLDDFLTRVNADIVGKFVNIASRCAPFIHTFFSGLLAADLPDFSQYQHFVAQLEPIQQAYNANNPAAAVRQIMLLADGANKYIDDEKPWILAKSPEHMPRLHAVCTQALNLFRVLAALLRPILPTTCAAAEAFLAAPLTHWQHVKQPLLSHRIQPYTHLFTRLYRQHILTMTQKLPDSPPSAPPAQTSNPTMVNIDDFAKLDLRIATVTDCTLVEGSDKLLRFELDAGLLGKRQIFSGIRASYPDPSKLIGRSVVFIANLAPRKMRFGLSEGMILSAGHDGGRLSLLNVDADAQAGMPVR